MTPSQISRAVISLIVVFASIACEREGTLDAETKPEKARPAKIVSVLSGGVSMLRTYPGTLEASEKAELAFRVGGELDELPAQAGLTVKRGDVLARLDEADFRNALDERKARFELAEIQYDQAKKLLKQKLSSQLKHDQAAAELKSARAALEQARDNLAYTRLTAPFDGIVARVDVENHQAVQAMIPVIKLQNEGELDIRFSVPESLISRLAQVEDPARIAAICGTVRFAAHGEKTFQACHKEHESVPDALTRNYSAVFALETITDFVVLPGMTATIEIDFADFLPEERASGLLIPVESVFEQAGEKWVWRVNPEMKAQRTPVKVGRLDGAMLEVTEGLSADDRVVAAGVSYVREGMRLKPMVKERGL